MIKGAERVTIMETETRRTIIINVAGGFINGKEVPALSPAYTELVPLDHFARDTAERLAESWTDIQAHMR